jgi:hypothetical protein
MDLVLQHNLTDSQTPIHSKSPLTPPCHFLSDVCDATKNPLLPEICTRCPITVSHAIELYPHQEAPPHAAWGTFIKLVQLQELDLGNWLSKWKSHQQWNYVYSPSQGYYWCNRAPKVTGHATSTPPVKTQVPPPQPIKCSDRQRGAPIRFHSCRCHPPHHNDSLNLASTENGGTPNHTCTH